MTEWDIKPRASSCSSCHKLFSDNETYHTLLALDAEGYKRQDLCDHCGHGASRDTMISYWQGEYRVPPPPPPEPIQKETAETLLRKLVESTDPEHSAARYILAVMLERKRMLKHRETVQGESGNELLVYEHTRTGESFTLPDPHLRLDQIQAVQTQVVQQLQLQPKQSENAETETSADSTSAKPVS